MVILKCDEFADALKKEIKTKNGKKNIDKIKKGGNKLFFGVFRN
jgi:hypothetical protein